MLPMFNYNVNWSKIVKENIPYFFQNLKRLNWIDALIKPLKVILTAFAQVREDYIYKVAYTAQVIYLEKILNDKFDNTDRRIYISDYGTNNAVYLYKKIESKPPLYLYRKWKDDVNYLVGEYSVEDNLVYKALTNNDDSQPSLNPADWEFYKTVTFLRKKSESSMVTGFVVNVPTALIYDDSRFRATINYYRFAGKKYIINTY